MIIEPASVRMFYRAILTLRVLPDPDARYFPIETCWIDAPREWHAYGAEPIYDYDDADRYVPTPHDVARYLDVLAWGRGLSGLQYRIMECRADDYSLELCADVVRLPLGLTRTEFRLAVETVDHASQRRQHAA